MKKFIFSLLAMMSCAVFFTACDDNSTSGAEPDPVDPDPVEEQRKANTWIFNEGEAVEAGSVLIYESSGQITALFSGVKDLTTVMDFENTDDYTEITFPVSSIGEEINLTTLEAGEGEVYIFSHLPQFDMKSGLLIDGGDAAVSEGTLSSSLENDEMTICCAFTTAGTGIRFDVYLKYQLVREDPDALKGSYYEYAVKSRDISGTDDFGKGFYLRYDGWTFTYSASSSICSYIQVGNNNYVEIHVNADELMDGKPFNVAETEYPFSFTFVCIDRKTGETITSVIDNNNRAGASGTITIKPTVFGLYDAQFDLSFESGDVTVKGYYAAELQPRNMVYTGGVGNLAELRSATLDISGDPCVLYLSSQDGQAGPDRYDMKCSVPANEWRFNYFMAFGGQNSSVTWTDGIVYNKETIEGTSVFGGNWKVLPPAELPGGEYATECTAMLFGSSVSYAYYYGTVNIIK
ncbi:MAG: hypothetical protein K2H98_04490 [Duncaniella sp.]|nr:hypothetical protein [Duncaniella sp.]